MAGRGALGDPLRCYTASPRSMLFFASLSCCQPDHLDHFQDTFDLLLAHQPTSLQHSLQAQYAGDRSPSCVTPIADSFWIGFLAQGL